jgi:hypothetical protein
MHAVANASLPAQDEKTNAVLLYSETDVNVISMDKIKTVQRRAYKILRPEGRDYGTALVSFRSPGEKINNMKGWCISRSRQRLRSEGQRSHRGLSS